MPLITGFVVSEPVMTVCESCSRITVRGWREHLISIDEHEILGADWIVRAWELIK